MDSSSRPLILLLVRAPGPVGWQLWEMSASGHLGDSLGVAGGGPRATLPLNGPILLASPLPLQSALQALLSLRC